VGENQLPAQERIMTKKSKGKVKRGLRLISTSDIAIEHLVIEDRFRDPTDKDVEMLAESLEEHGQPRSISVRKHQDKPEKYRVIAGATLVKAAEKLKWPSVRADVFKCSDVAARRWEIDENLNRHQLNALEEAEHIAGRMQTFANEEAESGQKDGKPKQGRPLGTISKAAGKLRLKGKTQKARRKEIERGLKVASIAPEAKAAAKEAGLHDDRAALLEIADQDTTEEQLTKVQELARGKTSSKAKGRNPWLRNAKTKKTKPSASKPSLSPKDKEDVAKLLKLWNEAAKLKRGFDKACQAVRDSFIERIQESASSEEDDTETELNPTQQDDQELDGNNNDNDDRNDANDNNDNDNDDEDNEQSNDSDWV
jgi:ParB/RepB/Spo0J family partition protein